MAGGGVGSCTRKKKKENMFGRKFGSSFVRRSPDGGKGFEKRLSPRGGPQG